MAALLVDVADAIAAELNTASLSCEFEAVRSFADWEMELTDHRTLHVDVVPVEYSEASALASRREVSWHIVTDIGVRQKFGAARQQQHTGRILTEEVDRLVLLVEEIAEHFIPGDLPGFATARWASTVIRAAYVREHLRLFQQFTGIVRLTHIVDRDL